MFEVWQECPAALQTLAGAGLGLGLMVRHNSHKERRKEGQQNHAVKHEELGKACATRQSDNSMGGASVRQAVAQRSHYRAVQAAGQDLLTK